MFPRRAVVSLSIALMCDCFVACNVFNPSGDGDPDSPAAWVIEGNKCLQNKEFDKAGVAFNNAIRLDSVYGDAWDGWLEVQAKKAEDSSNLTTDSLVGLLWHERDSLTADGASMPFMSKPLSLKNQLYRYVRILALADSTYLADYLFHGQKTDSGQNFPDHYRKQVYVGLKSAVAVLRLCDYNRDLRIDSTDTVFINLCSDQCGGLSSTSPLIQSKLLKLATLVDSTTGAVDSAKTDSLNKFLQTASQSMDQLKTLVSGQGVDSAQWGQVSTFLSTRGDEVVFYQGSDQRDNDGDGCVDEEIPDSYDNDGDGFVDEDFRLGTERIAQKFENLSAQERGDSLAGKLAIRAPYDNVDSNRLVSTNAGDSAVKGDSRGGYASTLQPPRDTSSALRYVSKEVWARHPGLFEKYRPYADEEHADFKVKHWKTSVEWEVSDTAGLYAMSGPSIPMTGDSASNGGKAILSHAQLRRIRLAILAISNPHDRVVAGRRFVGGCWMDAAIPTKDANSKLDGK